jgi:hypothetical protein
MAARLTLKQAIDDLGWFWGVFTSLVNAPSLLALLQMVFEYRFVEALQWIVDGYTEIIGWVGAALEPILLPLIEQLNVIFGWSLELQPQWRPLLLVALIPATSLARQAWRSSSKDDVIEPLAIGVGAIMGVVAAAVVPLDGRWWTQGLMAALPIGAALLFYEVTIHATNLFKAPINRDPFGALFMLPYVAAFCALSFALGAGLSFAPALRDGAGIIALGIMVFAMGCFSLANGLSLGERNDSRMGLTMLGAFVAAGFILGADALLKIIG